MCVRGGNKKPECITALVDTGAETTIITRQQARALGVGSSQGEPAVITTYDGSRIAGFSTKAEVRVGKRRAEVKVFVPTYHVNVSNEIQERARDRPIVGVDFLQQSGAKLDFAKPHALVFEGATVEPRFVGRPKPMSKQLQRKLLPAMLADLKKRRPPKKAKKP